MSETENENDKKYGVEKGKELREEHGQIGALKRIFGMVSEDVDEAKESVKESLKAPDQTVKDESYKFVCRECSSELERGDISRCPHCGYNPKSHNKWRMIHSVLTGVSVASIVGIPIAPIAYLKAQKHRKLLKKGVAKSVER